MREQVLPEICRLLELLARIAENAQSETILPEMIDIVGAERVDAIAVLAGAAAARLDAFDAVAGDDGAVFRRLPAMHEDAAIGAVGDGVAGDLPVRSASTE